VLQVRTAVEYRETVGGNAIVLPTAGADLRVGDCDDRRDRLVAERAVDEALADSFPASDPPSWTPGITRPAPVANVRPPEAEAVATFGDRAHELSFLRSRAMTADASV
jgi:hypothetical protein